MTRLQVFGSVNSVVLTNASVIKSYRHDVGCYSKVKAQKVQGPGVK